MAQLAKVRLFRVSGCNIIDGPFMGANLKRGVKFPYILHREHCRKIKNKRSIDLIICLMTAVDIRIENGDGSLVFYEILKDSVPHLSHIYDICWGSEWRSPIG